MDWGTGEVPALLQAGEMVLTRAQQARLFAIANGKEGVGGQVLILETPVYLDGRLISKSTTRHQYTDVMIKRLK